MTSLSGEGIFRSRMNANKSLSRRQKLDLNRRKIAAISFLSNIQVGLKGQCHQHKQVPVGTRCTRRPGVQCCVVFRDPTSYFDADLDPGPDPTANPTPNYTHDAIFNSEQYLSTS